jgi:Arc/MetJ-type ribon-helix-helix transcriptional regulator
MAKKTVPILVHFSKRDIDKIDKLVKDGFYASRTEAIRDAVRSKIEQLLLEDKSLNLLNERKIEKFLKEYIEEDPHERLKKIGL